MLTLSVSSPFGAVPSVRTTTTPPPPRPQDAGGLPVYRQVTRMHGGLTGKDQVAWQKALKHWQTVGGGFGPTIVMVQYLKTGKYPFAKFTNMVDHRTWGKYYNVATNIMTVKPVPPSGGGIFSSIYDFGKAIVDGVVGAAEDIGSGAYGVVKTVLDKGCKLLQTSTGQLVATGAAAAGGPQGASAAGAANLVCSVMSPTPTIPNPGMPGAPPMSEPPAAALKYPQGSIARFNLTRRVWSIYVPGGGQVAGFGVATTSRQCLYGDCGLGADVVDPPPPSGTVKVGEEAIQPANTPAVGTETDGKPFYKKPLFWVIVGGGALVLGGGIYALTR